MLISSFGKSGNLIEKRISTSARSTSGRLADRGGCTRLPQPLLPTEAHDPCAQSIAALPHRRPDRRRLVALSNECAERECTSTLAHGSWLDETGAPMKVQQELMRHASIQTTMNVYRQAMSSPKRETNGKVVEMVLKPLKASA